MILEREPAWKALINQAINLCRASETHGISKDDPAPYDVLDDQFSTLVCGAVVTCYAGRPYHQPKFSLQGYAFDLDARVFWEPLEYWLYVVACFVGDLGQYHKALEVLRNVAGHSKTDLKELDRMIFSCLRVAASAGHELIVSHILSLGPDNSEVELSLLHAADSSHLRILQLLLRHYEKHDPFSTLSTIKGTLLDRACQLNNLDVVEFVLSTGSVAMYNPSPLVTRSPLTMAINNGHEHCVRLLLRNRRQSAEAPDLHKSDFLRWGAEAIERANNLDMFKEIVPHPSRKWALLIGAGIDGGVKAAFTTKRHFDLDALLEDGPYNFSEPKIGAEALHRAIAHVRAQNVEILLEKGVRLTKLVTMGQADSNSGEHIRRLFVEEAPWGVKN